jgi:cell division protein FtsW
MARLRTDWILFFTILAMVGFGIVMLYSASSIVAELRYDLPPYYFLLRQVLWSAGSFVVLMYLKKVDYRRLNTPAWAFSGLGIVLSLLMVVYFVDEQHRWFRLSGIGSFQPSEFAKPALILFLAYFLARRTEVINDRRTLKQALLPIAVLGFLVVLSDLGTAMVPVVTALIVLWVAGLDRKIMMRFLAAGLALAMVAIVARPYRLGRVLSYVDSDCSWVQKLDPNGLLRSYIGRSSCQSDGSYQPRQSKIAVGAGGILGVGLMNGRQKLMFLPEAHTDFIYATISEELGLWGSTAVLAGFLVILWRGARLFMLARDDFGKYLALGVTVSIVVQALVNISVVLDMGPAKGFPLPMISFGGSSLLSTLVSLGMLLSVGEHEG